MHTELSVLVFGLNSVYLYPMHFKIAMDRDMLYIIIGQVQSGNPHVMSCLSVTSGHNMVDWLAQVKLLIFTIILLMITILLILLH